MNTNNEQPTQTPSSTQTSSWTKEEADLFAFDDLHIIACDDQESDTSTIEPQLYLQSLETRVAKALDASKGFTDLVKIAEAYDDDRKINIRLDTTPVSSNDFDALITGIQKKDVATVATEFGDFKVPIPTMESIPKYQTALSNVAAASLKTLFDTSTLLRGQRVNAAKLATHVSNIAKEAILKYSNKVDRRDIMESILKVMIVERVKEKQIQTICDMYSKPEMWVDPLTSGLWIVNPDEKHLAVSAARKRKVQSIYEMDDNLTQSLIALAFSRKPRETAAAKLNLFARVKGSKRDDIKADPRRMLSIVFSESELSQNEIKAMIFTRPKEQSTSCPLCDLPVEIDGITYHQECDVVHSRLVKHFFFKYDPALGILSTQMVVFLDHNQRALLENIQRHHRTLNKPFKIKGAAKYSVMQKDGDSMKTLTSLTTNPATMPGTPEWMERQCRGSQSYQKRH